MGYSIPPDTRHRVFTELTRECDITAQMYAAGKEKKEIAEIKCKAVSTISNQLQKAFEILHIRNGRELSMLYAKKVTGVEIIHSIIASFFLCILVIDYHEDLKRTQRTRVRTERLSRARTRARTREFSFA